MNGDLGFLAGNFLQAFAQGTEKKKQDDENKRYKKLLSDALEFQIDQMHKQQGAQNDLSSMMAQPVSQPAAPVPQYQSPPDGVLGMMSQVGSTPAPASMATNRPRNLMDILSDPQGRMAAIRSGQLPELQKQDQMLAQSDLAKGIAGAGGDPTSFLQSAEGAALAVRAGMTPAAMMQASGTGTSQALDLARLQETMRHNRSMESSATSAPVGAMSPDELDYAGRTIMMDPARMKDFASYGNAGQAYRQQINDWISKRMKETGQSPESLAQLRVNFQAQKGSIQKMTAQANAIQAFEGVAKYNGDRLLELIDKIDNTGVPFIEGIARPLKRGAGDVDTAEALSVLNTFQTEVSRILGNPNMTGVISDGARHEAQDMVNGKLSAAQMKRVVNRLFDEMDMRNSLISTQITNAGTSMTTGNPTASPEAPTQAPKRVRVDAQGNVIQ